MISGLIARLRDRKLVQWALAYLAGAWLLLQVTDILGNQFDWPDALLRSITVLLAVGFLAALVLAWYHGEQGRQRVSGVELLMLAGVLVLAGAAVAFVGRGEDAQAELRLAGPVPDIVPPRAERNSVAVLPFANLSRDPDNEYFSDGITDEILTTLAIVGDLRVISRTSVMRYKNTQKSLREIAAELGVAHILEGSVQRAGERVRITAQLIDARTDTQLWAQRYDRPLEDIFAVQSAIAQEIARALRVNLSAGEQARLARQGTANLTAYDYVLRAREHLRGSSPHDGEAALSLLRRARELDTEYPDALAVLSDAYRYQTRNTSNLAQHRMWLDSAVVAARRSIALDPEFAPGYAELGWSLNLLGERDAALEALLRAVQLNSNLSGGLANVYHYGFGRLDEAARWWRPALEADPTNAFIVWLAGRTYLNLGMPARARPLLEKAITLQPEYFWAYYNLSTAALLEDRPEEARAQVQRMLTATAEAPGALIFAGYHALAMGDLEAARRFFDQGMPGATSWFKPWGGIGLGWVRQRSGDTERAREVTRTAAREFEHVWGGSPKSPEEYADLARVRVLQSDREGALQAFAEGVRQGWRFYNENPDDPILGSLRGDPRYDRLMAEVKADVDRMRARVEREGW